MSRAIDGLVRRGYVKRTESTEDRRAKLVRLLPAGHGALDQFERGRLSTLEDFMATLSDEERAGLHAVLLPIVERIPPMTIVSASRSRTAAGGLSARCASRSR